MERADMSKYTNRNLLYHFLTTTNLASCIAGH
jgi:hypothetical protein